MSGSPRQPHETGMASTPFDPTIAGEVHSGLPERYEVLSILGAGGMGRVLHARDKVLDREVAIKVLADHHAADATYAERFLNEARSAAKLNHPNIVQIYEYGREGDCIYLVMEYVDGASLKTEMRDKGRYSEARATELVAEAGRALGAAHQQGIVHRDVKPDNMMLTAAGEFKLVDLGLAKQLERDVSHTVTGQSMGTPHYISPEQILGAKVIDHRADIYSLGASLYCLATGCVPFEGSTGAHIMSRHLNDPLPDPRRIAPELSSGFCRLVGRAMEKDPARRYQDTRELAADLAAVRAAAPAAPPHVRPEAADMTVAILETPSGAAFCPTLTPPVEGAELRQVEVALARAIGPMAKVLVGRECRTAGSRSELVHNLAAHINVAAERKRFFRACSIEDSGSVSVVGTGSRASLEAPAASPEVQAELVRLLAGHIGPVARVLVKREAAAGVPVAALVERLAAHVPDGNARQVFLAAAAPLS